MTTQVALPLLSMSMSEGTIVEWLVEDGDIATEGEPLYSIEDEKTVMDVAAPATGVLKQKVEAGTTVPVGTEIAEIG